MNFVLKIVEGPNKGAEIALVEGVAVTLGKGDGCDIVLADSTMPDSPLKIETSVGEVSIDGTAIAPFDVKTCGATSFAVGPADGPWEPLKWPNGAGSSSPQPEGEKQEQPGDEGAQQAAPAAGESAGEENVAEKEEKSPLQRGLLLCIIAGAVVAILLLIAIVCSISSCVRSRAKSRVVAPSIASVVEKYGLELVETGGVAKICGNLKTRRERLAATAEAYGTMPGIELDISDDESFRTAAEDALFTLTEGALGVKAATNRFLEISGVSFSPEALRRTLGSLASDLPKLRDVDVKGVLFGAAGSPDSPGPAAPGATGPGRGVAGRLQAAANPSLPVCGILVNPYPCLVMKNGERILEGAPLGAWIVSSIGDDSVVLTNSTGRFEWKP